MMMCQINCCLTQLSRYSNLAPECPSFDQLFCPITYILHGDIMTSFDNLLLSYAHSESESERKKIEEELWKEYGVEEAVMVMDMSGFSQMTQKYGVIHYLSMVKRMQAITQPIIERHRGHVVKFEADNCFSRFKEVIAAIRAAIGINHAIEGMNLMTPDEFDIQVSCGIDFGRFLLIKKKDFFGNAVNKASKLGEDISGPGEILVTKEAMDYVGEKFGIQTELVNFNISGISLEAHLVLY
jgi:adenylate cyclase